ncbi:DNA adenine methylase [Acidovorax delafieldii]|uniref:DNA adenine methylase n=1 Tax=Acidovorax delafieldii TaxID=47920 RepID=UPI0028648B25|nr:DNA adenine methylase [Acidovorax delafieldii]MDR6153870.1 DNA adenine methylase [Acidovorax delafieldii]
MSAFYSPLRYPGGKTKLADYVKAVLRANKLLDGTYAEPYAGGCSIALELVIQEFVQHIHINDIDRSIWSFWHSVLNDTDALCAMIQDTPVNLETWIKMRGIQANKHQEDSLDLGFSTFFLNRTNRSGIISAGVIGGKNQNGNYKIDARYAKEELIRRVQLIANHRSRISLHQLDAKDFLKDIVAKLPEKTLVYLDPPYYVKGGDLYTHHYGHDDHKEIAACVENIAQQWMVSYDDAPAIRDFYSKYTCLTYSLSYSAQKRYRGTEVLFLGPKLISPGLQGSMQEIA